MQDNNTNTEIKETSNNNQQHEVIVRIENKNNTLWIISLVFSIIWLFFPFIFWGFVFVFGWIIMWLVWLKNEPKWMAIAWFVVWIVALATSPSFWALFLIASV